MVQISETPEFALHIWIILLLWVSIWIMMVKVSCLFLCSVFLFRVYFSTMQTLCLLMLLLSIADSFDQQDQPKYKRMNFRNSNHASYSGLKWYEPRYRYYIFCQYFFEIYSSLIFLNADIYIYRNRGSFFDLLLMEELKRYVLFNYPKNCISIFKCLKITNYTRTNGTIFLSGIFGNILLKLPREKN